MPYRLSTLIELLRVEINSVVRHAIVLIIVKYCNLIVVVTMSNDRYES